jgi:hypothetical protein
MNDLFRGVALQFEAIGAETAGAVVASDVVSFPEVAMRIANVRARQSVPSWQVYVPFGKSGP